uniref:Uncharacterized protein n=1 Tax=Panagrellus redivivus TaxID=6233 RepID=A0A7E4W2F5_PANRE
MDNVHLKRVAPRTSNIMNRALHCCDTLAQDRGLPSHSEKEMELVEDCLLAPLSIDRGRIRRVPQADTTNLWNYTLGWL